jgi:membrane protein DedA with SNARE-associated domain
MPYGRFLAWNAIGGIAWGATFVVLGNLAGSSYHLVAAKAGRYTAITLAVIVVVGLVVWHFRRERAGEL